MDYSKTFSEYMKKPYGKFAIVITKNQYAAEFDGPVHEWMVCDLIKKTRPDIETDSWGNAINKEESYENGNIIVLGYPGYLSIELPRKE